MEYRHLGKSGLKISALSFGSWVTFGDQIFENEAYQCMKAAYDSGVNFFDNAEAYNQGASEEIMGKVLKRAGWKRSDLVISTKLFWGGPGPNDQGLSRKHILEGCQSSLKRMGLEYLDLIFCHRPDRETPIEETVRAMSYLVDNGYALYWGTSEWSRDEITEAYLIARQEHLVPPSMEQPEYNMFNRRKIELEYLRLYDEIGLGTTIWSPLASGLLSGKYNNGIPEGSRITLKNYEWLKSRFESKEGQEKIAKVRQLSSLAEKLGISCARMSLAWCLKNRDVSTVITGASRPEQVLENMKAVEDLKLLDSDIMDRINSILNNSPEVTGGFRTN